MNTTLANELSADGPVVFYDGDCGLCDWLVKFLIKHDKTRRLRYATLQGETATQLMGVPQGPSGSWSVKLLDERGLHDASTAAIRSIAHAGGIGKLAIVLLLVPRPIREAVYRWIARNRYRWFGTVDTCIVPTPALRQRFLP